MSLVVNSVDDRLHCSLLSKYLYWAEDTTQTTAWHRAPVSLPVVEWEGWAGSGGIRRRCRGQTRLPAMIVHFVMSNTQPFLAPHASTAADLQYKPALHCTVNVSPSHQPGNFLPLAGYI